MSIINRASRALWRGVSKLLGSASATTVNQSVRKVCLNTSVQKSINFLGNPICAFGNNNFVTHARRKACKEFLQKNRRRLALASFIGLYMTETSQEERKPNLNTLFENYFQDNFKSNVQDIVEEEYPSRISEYEIVKRLGRPSSYGAVYHAKHNSKDVAVKMMFNHHSSPTSSASNTILKNFKREYELLDSSNTEEKLALKRHPYIIPLKKKFVDKTAVLYDSEQSYPFYMPRNIDGSRQGCSKTLYLVMPKYACTLHEFLKTNQRLPLKVSLHLLCQLLEGVAYLERNNIAHRDLKSDNILIKVTNDNNVYPELVIADFGSCFTGDENGMLLPYQSEYVDKGGNPALMAPEILHTEAGHNVYLDYKKADVWAVGAIAHEIFGQDNPLYKQQPGEKFPPLKSSHWLVDAVIYNILQEDPSLRLSACVASNILCLLHFNAPCFWFPFTNGMELQRWLIQMAFLVKRGEKNTHDPHFNNELFKTFVCRVTLQEILETLERFSTLNQQYMVEHYLG